MSCLTALISKAVEVGTVTWLTRVMTQVVLRVDNVRKESQSLRLGDAVGISTSRFEPVESLVRERSSDRSEQIVLKVRLGEICGGRRWRFELRYSTRACWRSTATAASDGALPDKIMLVLTVTVRRGWW